ncbi:MULTISPECIES: Zn-ribbon domain-containing OB-fold protein [Pseudomonas]|uniref:Zn-ribbon domain-containing OB-fold protein n=1 Tax=Pseudomonas TaxID=286 RepID=UPI0038283C07
MAIPLPTPIANADSQPYWDAARDGRLMIQHCTDCGSVHFMARQLCPSCWSQHLEWVPSQGTGKVHSFTIIRRASLPAFTAQVPYVVALIELDEGPSMVSNIVGADALDVQIDDRVQVTFEARGDDARIPQFSRT